MKKHDADIELGAYGIANLVAGTLGAPLSVGIPAPNVANVQCGGSTRLSNLLHAFFLILIGFLTLGSHFIAQIPLAALAGVTAFVGARLLDWGTWQRFPMWTQLVLLLSGCGTTLSPATASNTTGPIARTFTKSGCWPSRRSNTFRPCLGSPGRPQ